MQRHVANGGLPYDDIGKSIIEMSEQIAQLKSFNNYVVRNDLMNSNTNGIVERSSTALNNLREQLKRMSKQGHYEAYIENFQAQTMPEVPQEVVEDYTEKFTVKNFKEDIKSVFPVLYKLMQENDNTIDYDDIVEMTGEEDVQETSEVSAYDPFAQFEEWAMTLGERSAIQDPEQQNAALGELNQLMGQHFPAGVDGTNAIESLTGIIDDPALHKQIEQASKEDSEICVRPMVKQWLEANAPEVLEKVDFGDMQEESANDEDGAKKSDVPAALRKAKGDKDWKLSTKDLDKEKERNISSSEWLKKHNEASDDKEKDEDPPFDADDEPSSDKDEYGNVIKHKAKHLARKGMRQAMDVKELAEFISSFYDKDSGTFPKGPEGVATMVGKKFGERAEHAARKMVERMAPQQAAPELQELGRMRELAGMPEAGVAEAQSQYYYEKLADEVFALDPDLDTSGRADEVLNAAFPLMVRDLGSKKRANNLLNYDEDFPSDFVSAYGELQRNRSKKGSDTISKMFGGDAKELTKDLKIREGYADFFDKKMAYQKIGATVDGSEQDYTVTFRDGKRKRYLEKNGRRQVVTLEPVNRQDDVDDEGNVIKRGRGRPTGPTKAPERTTAKAYKHKGKREVSEDDIDPADRGEYDREGDMALNQLHQIADAAEELHSILNAEENLPEWVQSKITKAVDYLDTARDYLKAKKSQYQTRGEEAIAEKAVSRSQQQAAGAALAAKRGEGKAVGASREMMKMSTKELEKFAGTKHKGLPDKKKTEAKDDAVEETTTAGSVATGGDKPAKANSMFGKGVYEGAIAESFERKLSQQLNESISINTSISTEGGKNITVTATEEDADKLSELLKMAGLFGSGEYTQVDSQPETCQECGSHGGLHEAECPHSVNEEYANEPNAQYGDMEMLLKTMSGGVNGPKRQVNPNNPGDNPLAMKRLAQRPSGQVDLGAVAEGIEKETQTRLWNLYKKYQ
jgi:hypothetical protein